MAKEPKPELLPHVAEFYKWNKNWIDDQVWLVERGRGMVFPDDVRDALFEAVIGAAYTGLHRGTREVRDHVCTALGIRNDT